MHNNTLLGWGPIFRVVSNGGGSYRLLHNYFCVPRLGNDRSLYAGTVCFKIRRCHCLENEEFPQTLCHTQISQLINSRQTQTSNSNRNVNTFFPPKAHKPTQWLVFIGYQIKQTLVSFHAADGRCRMLSPISAADAINTHQLRPFFLATVTEHLSF